MAEAEKERLNQLLRQHLDTNGETLELLRQPWFASLSYVSWDDVLELGEELYKQATAVGTLWTGEGPDATALEESMETYSNLLHRFLLLSQGSIFGVRTRTALYEEMCASVEAVVYCSFKLLKESVASYGNLL
ncbi:putative cyclin-D1-binding protein [Helianthus annuus]|nr:putative cyclin-D1-binding protein [Helianthus annuus]KAJ0648329.1 putative cyclin-D1-binding protein [Helianthus annuus]KAJ0652165.1 putative cyclin-D1-binding protein [Helianthus annuus]